MRKSIKRNETPKAFAGAAFAIGSAIASLAGSAISAYNAKRQADEQRKQQDYQNALISAQSMSDYLNGSQSLQDVYDRQNRMIVRCGGRKKMAFGGRYSSTGVLPQGVKSQFPLIPVGTGLFYDNSRSHEAGGNKIRKNGKTVFEQEKGEILDLRHGGEARVLSSLPGLGINGISPSHLVLKGMNPDIAYNIQEGHKGMRNGGRQSIKKARWGWNEDWGTSGLKYGDAYNAGINLITNGINTGLGLWAANNMKAPSAPRLMTRSALPTRYNVAAQIGAVGNAAASSIDYINRNISNSAAAREAATNIRMNEASQIGQINENKENKQNEMIAANTRYLDEGKQYNLSLMNQYDKERTDFENAKIAAKSNALQTGSATISDTADNLDKTINSRVQDKLNILGAMASGNPQVINKIIDTSPELIEYLLGPEWVKKYRSNLNNSEILPNGDRYVNGIRFDSKFFERCGGRKSLKRR